jgi:ABC-type transporter Mla MlaB component
MSTMPAQICKGSTFTIERRRDLAADCVIFRFSGPFTARDCTHPSRRLPCGTSSMSDPPHHVPSVNIFDLTDVPYMDSCGLGLLMGHFVRCQGKGVQLIAAGVKPRVMELFKTTKVEHLFPITATVDEASNRRQPKA